MIDYEYVTTKSVVMDIVYPDHITGDITFVIDIDTLSRKRCIALVRELQKEYKEKELELYDEAKTANQVLSNMTDEEYQNFVVDVKKSVVDLKKFIENERVI